MRISVHNIGAAVLLTAAAAAAASCAKDVSASSNEQTKIYLDAWAKTHYGISETSGNGIYLLEDKAGGGKEFAGEPYVILDYTVSSLDGTITGTTIERIAQQVGSYKPSNYYGPRTWYYSEESIPVGIEDMLRGMRIGGTRKALIPFWLMDFTRYKSKDEYIKHTPEKKSTTIYTVTLRALSDNIVDSQIDSIKAYMAANNIAADSLKGHYGFHYKELVPPANNREFPSDTSVYINYTGRRLDGKVFDTTIKDTAIRHEIYSASKTYKPIKITWGGKWQDIKMTTSSNSSESSSSPISGFQLLLWNMRAYGKSAAIFTSPYGYDQSGSGSAIPAYAPLHFEVELTDNPEK